MKTYHEHVAYENPIPVWAVLAGVAAVGGGAYWLYYQSQITAINAKADALGLPHVGVTSMVGSIGVTTDSSGNVTFSYGTVKVAAPITSLQLYNGQYTSNVPAVQAVMNQLPTIPTTANGGLQGVPTGMGPALYPQTPQAYLPAPPAGHPHAPAPLPPGTKPAPPVEGFERFQPRYQHTKGGPAYVAGVPQMNPQLG